MKKIKVFIVLIFSMIIVSGCSCTQSMCTAEDLKNIKAEITEKWDNDTYKQKLRDEAMAKDITSETEIEKYITQHVEKKIEDEYNSHPKACLTTIEMNDPDTGASISKKTWKKAFTEGGLLEGLIVYPISWLFITFANLFGNTGGGKVLSIVVSTIIIKMLMLFFTFKSQVQNQKMQLLQADFAEINAKLRDPELSQNEKARLQMKMYDIYKKHNINPLAGIVPQLVSLPIFLSVWSAVSQTLVIRSGDFLKIDLGKAVSTQVFGLNLGAIVLFILMAGLQILSMNLPTIIRKRKADYKTKKKIENTDNQMKMMMNIMIVMILITGFMLPAALAIYWTTGALFSIVQTIVFQNDKVKEKLNSLSNRKKKAKVVQ